MYTRTRTTTFTVARVRQVMDNVLDDLQGLVARGFLTRDEATSWHGDLLFLLLAQAIDVFEIQLSPPLGAACGLRYRVRDDGLIQGTMPSGGVDFYAFPRGTAIRLIVEYRAAHANLPAIRAEMARRGWGGGASLLSGTTRSDRMYGAGGWGLERARVGDWDD